MLRETSVSTQLISHIRTFRDEAWDPAVLRKTELCLLDSLGCYSAGRSLKHYEPMANVASAMFGQRCEAPVAQAPSPFATAYLYGSAANLLDYDDTIGSGHPGAAIVGAVLSVAADRELTTDRLLRGIAAGYETQWFLGMAGAPTPERAALVRSVGIWDSVAAAVGITVALGLDDTLVEHAAGLAVAHSILPYTAKWYERPVPSIKNNLGWAGAGAVLAAELAIAGKTGVTNAFEGETGMWRMAGSDQWKLDPALLEKAAVLRVGFKAYPVCWHLQQYLRTLANQLALKKADDDIVEIVLTGPAAIRKFCNPELLSPTDTAFSLPAAASLLIAGVEPGPLWVAYESDEVLRYRNVFRFELSDVRSIRLRTQQGAELHSDVSVGHAFDMADEGLNEAEVLAKHARLTAPDLQAGAAAALSRASRPAGEASQLYDAFRRSVAGRVGN